MVDNWLLEQRTLQPVYSYSVLIDVASFVPISHITSKVVHGILHADVVGLSILVFLLLINVGEDEALSAFEESMSQVLFLRL